MPSVMWIEEITSFLGMCFSYYFQIALLIAQTLNVDVAYVCSLLESISNLKSSPKV